MKKTIALITALLLCLSMVAAASADEEVPRFYWADKEDEVRADAGDFYTLGKANLRIWIPRYMSLTELSEEDAESGFTDRFVGEDPACSVGITMRNQGVTYDEFYEYVVDCGAENVRQIYINDLLVILYHYVRGENDESNVISIVTNDGHVLEFIFTGDDGAFMQDSKYIAYSIQLVPEDNTVVEEESVRTVSWGEYAGLLEEAEIEGDFYKLGNFNVIAWIPSFLQPVEQNENNESINWVAEFSSEDGADTVLVTLPKVGEFTSGKELLESHGARNVAKTIINDLIVFTYSYTNQNNGEDYNCAILFLGDGDGLNFQFSSGDEIFDTCYPFIVMSIQLEQ